MHAVEEMMPGKSTEVGSHEKTTISLVAISLACLAYAGSGACSLTVGEDFVDPIGFYEATPAFSWKLPKGTKAQTAYQVEVRDIQSKTVVWDSGSVESDQFVVPARADNRIISLEEAFATSIAIVNLFSDRDDNAGVFAAPLFRSMMDSAVFINVGRGRQVNEADLVTVMKERADLTALLDVQWPEPPEDGSELYTLPNIRLSGHIAGSKGTELIRMADYMIDDFLRLERGEPVLHKVRPDQL